eukprot:TRINITY_DN9732_c0_g1_i1.p1 TRINITY_DN9732_c0_g1~~TRINITY_DN9732_c0_g1_i1.p1  ORF type:complete len:434 (+),score=144.97 TRINITY_DN9732_c0_g1_i1:104-1405(+)
MATQLNRRLLRRIDGTSNNEENRALSAKGGKKAADGGASTVRKFGTEITTSTNNVVSRGRATRSKGLKQTNAKSGTGTGRIKISSSSSSSTAAKTNDDKTRRSTKRKHEEDKNAARQTRMRHEAQRQQQEVEIAEPMEMAIDELEHVDDIDALDFNDPRFCTEYVDEIFEYLREMEDDNKCSHRYMSKQTEIDEAARTILFEWMIEVNIKLRFMTDTIFLACNIADRFLSKRLVARHRLQLVGTSAMLIALKYEELYQPEIRDLVYMTDGACEKESIVKMEHIILNTLAFNLGVPTPMHFLRRFSRAAISDSFMHTLSKYLMELTIPEYVMLKYLPSEIAAAAVFIARKMNSKEPTWTPTLKYYTRYTEESIMPCAMEMNKILVEAYQSIFPNDNEQDKRSQQRRPSRRFRGLTRKYSVKKYHQVALLSPVQI